MAKKEKFLLVSLNESKAKDLAQAVSNRTCRRILDYLADNESTESDIAESLGLPISTVHYNLMQLKKGGLVETEEFHYSSKGREVLHYKLANKYIIIAPRSTYGIKEKLKSIIPAALIVGAGSFLIPFISGMLSKPEKSVMLAEEVSSGMAKDSISRSMAAPEAAEIAASPDLILYFLAGALAFLAAYMVIDWIRNR